MPDIVDTTGNEITIHSSASSDHLSRVHADLMDIFKHLLGVDVEDIDENASFLELGADSLLLMQISQSIQRKFDVKIPFRQLLEEFASPAEVASYLAQQIPAEEPATVEAPAGEEVLVVAAAPAAPATVPVAVTAPAPVAVSEAPTAPVPISGQASLPGTVRREREPWTPRLTAGATSNGNGGSAHPDTVGAILERQLQIMDQQLRLKSEQLELLSQSSWNGEQTEEYHDDLGAPPPAVPVEQGAAKTPSPAVPAEQGAAKTPSPAVSAVQETVTTSSSTVEEAPASTSRRSTASPDLSQPTTGRRKPKVTPYVAYQPPKAAANELNPQQQEHLDGLVKRLEKRFGKSKHLAQKYRDVLADNRATVAFRRVLKELLYPIFFERGKGAKVWDVDGNELVDYNMGYGTLIFGHTPSFVTEALKKHSELGIGVGLEPAMVGEAAELICELSGNDRAAFVNDGTEAVMAAVRLARTKTGRNKIVTFQGGYHGWFDDVLGISSKGPDGKRRTFPMAPGVSPQVSDNVMVLDYCSKESIKFLEGYAHEIAAVVVDPQQARRPGSFNTRDFLHDLRRVTENAGAAMIMDEVVTGFRVHPGGAQHVFDVRADLVAYGKAVGAGLPVGVVSGKDSFMGGIDGGRWSYGDDSYPSADLTFVQGSYFKHPLIIPAVHAILKHYKEQGPSLQDELNRRTADMAREINTFFEAEDLPVWMLQWGSFCYFIFGPEVKYANLFFYHVLEKGLYVRDLRPWFLSTEHTDEDIEKAIEAVKASVVEMRAGGFLPGNLDSLELPPLPMPGSQKPRQKVQKAPSGLSGNRSNGGRSGRSAAGSDKDQDGEEDADPAGDRSLPLTQSQQALWLATQMNEDASRAYNQSLAWRLSGKIDAAALKRAGQRVVERHEALRLVFEPDGEQQHFRAQSAFKIEHVDLSGQPSVAREEKLEARLRALTLDPFDLVQGPLFRCALIRLGVEEHVLVVVFHHLVVDGWSFGVVLGELAHLYAAYVRGEEPQLPPALPFSDYVQAQSEPRSLAADEAYWLERFQGPMPVFEPPTDYPRPPLETFHGGSVTRRLDTSLTVPLRRLGGRSKATLRMSLLTGFAILLQRLAHQDDLVIGMPSAGQAAMPEGSLVGYCLQVLPIRNRFDASASFVEHLRETRRAVLDAQEHQSYSLTRLLRRVELRRDPSRAPLGVMFNLDRQTGAMSFDGLGTERIALPVETSEFELNLDIQEMGNELEANLEFRSDLFSPATVRRWLQSFENLLQAAVENPELPAGSLALMSPAERHQVLVEWNDGTVSSMGEPFAHGLCVHELFEAQAKRTPERIAVVWEDQQLTYGELDDKTNRLASRLRRLGAGPEILVGICLERSPDLLVALLGTLKAGAAYLPLDPSYPEARLAAVLADSGAPLVLRDEHWPTALDLYSGTVLEIDAKESEDGTPLDVAPTASPDNLAYVIYTSGSTGRPKGVQIQHHSLVNFLGSMAREPGLSDEDVLVSVTTPSFDISGLEFYLPLLVGARVVLASREVAADGDRLVALLEASQKTTAGKTVLQATPSTWRLLVATGWNGDVEVFCGGEALPQELADQLMARGKSVWNLYGPTETTIWSTCQRLKAGEGPVSVGRPIAQTSIDLLDSRLEPVPTGVPGEILIGGMGLARGYLNRPGLSAEKFVPHPWADGERLYRTGDLGRYRRDGSLECLGRLDNQVKVRGVRIELGEIEAVLAENPGVEQAVVTVYEKRSGDQRLVAYVVGPALSEAGTEGLRDALRRQLPDAMVPTVFLPLEEVPLTPNGKVDRRALPSPETVDDRGQANLEAPEGATEEAIAEIWQDVLGLQAVGVTENFFDLGGHSLLLIQVRQRLREVVPRELTLLELFQYPNVRALAAYLSNSDKPSPKAAAENRSQARRTAQGRRQRGRQRRKENRAR